MVKLLHADTGKHRSTVNIEKAARVTVKEDGTFCFVNYRQSPLDQPPAAEEVEVLPTMPPEANEAA
jgi:hypothetical protein